MINRDPRAIATVATLLLASLLGGCIVEPVDETPTAVDHGGCQERPMTDLPRVFGADPALLDLSRRRLADGDVRLARALTKLKAEADEQLSAGPFSVTCKTVTPPSGDKHDYFSFGPYWWPDPDKPDGLPYIRRDGEVNPASRTDASDRPQLEGLTKAVVPLAQAWYFTGDRRYAEHAAKLLRVWFMEPETKMNPNLDYAQAIPGRVDGRGIGIIDTAGLCGVIDAVGLLASYPGWSSCDQKDMEIWMGDYLDWLLTSRHGRDEAAHPNNHRSWYDAQVAAMALFTGRDAVAKAVFVQAGSRLMDRHIRPDGAQPHELARTRSLDYSCFNLRAMTTLAQMAETVDIDLWNHRGVGAGGIRDAVNYLAPYSDPAVEWPGEQILGREHAYNSLALILRQAAAAYDDPAYLAAFDKLPEDTEGRAQALLLYPSE